MLNALKKEKHLVITFETMTAAIYMDRLCKEKNLDGRTIPVPKEIDTGCGSAFATKRIDEEYWKNFMEENNVKYSKITILDF